MNATTRIVTRAVTLPVAHPVARLQRDDEVGPGGRREWVALDRPTFDAAVRTAFRLSAHLCNWVSQRMFAIDDVARTQPPDAVTKWEGYAAAMTCVRCGLRWSEDPLPARKRRAVLKCEGCGLDWREGTEAPCRCERPAVVVKKPAIDAPPNPQCACPGEPTPAYARYREWAGAKLNFGQCLETAKKKYTADRFEAFVQMKRGRAVFTYPQPYVIHSAHTNWSVRFEDRGREGPNGEAPGQRPVFEFALPGLGRVRVALRHARHEFYRELDKLRQVIDGTAVRRTAVVTDSAKNGFLVRLIADFPVRDRGPVAPTHACFLHADPNALLVAEIDGRRPWILNRDDLRDRAARHRAYRQRVGEDAKREKRMSAGQRRNLGTARHLVCAKNDRYMTTQVEQVAAQVARYWQRQGVAVVAYCDAEEYRFVSDGFRWFELKTKLRFHAEALGIEWIDAGDYLASAVPADRPTPPGEPAGSRGAYLSFPEGERVQWLQKVRATAAVGKRAVARARRAGGHPAVTPNSPSKPSPRPKRSRGSAKP